MLAQQQQFEDARELHLWSGQRPTDQLRAIGWPTPQLARRDRALVDRLAALPPDRQRTIARWAARRACEIARIDGLDWVAAGLAALGSRCAAAGTADRLECGVGSTVSRRHRGGDRVG